MQMCGFRSLEEKEAHSKQEFALFVYSTGKSLIGVMGAGTVEFVGKVSCEQADSVK